MAKPEGLRTEGEPYNIIIDADPATRIFARARSPREALGAALNGLEALQIWAEMAARGEKSTAIMYNPSQTTPREAVAKAQKP